MRKKIEFTGRSWEFPLGENGGGMLIKKKKYIYMYTMKRGKKGKTKVNSENLSRIRNGFPKGARSDGVARPKMNNTGEIDGE